MPLTDRRGQLWFSVPAHVDKTKGRTRTFLLHRIGDIALGLLIEGKEALRDAAGWVAVGVAVAVVEGVLEGGRFPAVDEVCVECYYAVRREVLKNDLEGRGGRQQMKTYRRDTHSPWDHRWRSWW